MLGGIPMPVSSPQSTFAEYATAWAKRLRDGESGVLPVVGGLILLVIIFQVQDSVFLSAGNLSTCWCRAPSSCCWAWPRCACSSSGEIDLSVGFIAGIGAVDHGHPGRAAPQPARGGRPSSPAWLATPAIGALQGVLVTRLRLPSFVVTLAGLLGWQGLLLYLVNWPAPAAPSGSPTTCSSTSPTAT